MSSKFLIRKSFGIALLCISIVFVLTFIVLNQYSPKMADIITNSLTISAGFFGGIATLTAAYVASKLFNDWRDEKKYDLENSLLSNILNNLNPMYVELLTIRNDFFNLKGIDQAYILKSDYIKSNRINILEFMLKSYSPIKTYCKVKSDPKLDDLYKKFEKYCFCLMNFNEIIFQEKYSKYYKKAINEIQEKTLGIDLENHNIYRSYKDNEKNILNLEIEEVLNLFKENAFTAQIGEDKFYTSFENWLIETINYYEQIQDYCINAIQVPD